MSDTSIKRELVNFDIQDFIIQQRNSGRAALDPEFKALWAGRYRYASELLDDERHGEGVRRIARLLKVITYSIAKLSENPIPTYYPYTDAHIIDWFIRKRYEKYEYYKVKSIEGIFHFLRDLLIFETESLAGIQRFQPENLEEAAVIKRIKTIREAVDACYELSEKVTGARIVVHQDPVKYNTLEEYVEEPSRISALLHFSCMPQTKFHDEVVFLRTIHVSELCFFGIRWTLIEAIENINRHILGTAVLCINQAIGFAKILHRIFKVLRTMPPEHFADFRDATGHASAVQSRNYQFMEVYFHGVNKQKQEIYNSIQHLSYLEQFNHPLFVHLGQAINNRQDSTDSWRQVLAAAQVLDKQLLTWRGLHLGFAKAYLPPHQPGTGATSGAAYLEKYLHAGLFVETKVDLDIVEEMFAELPEIPNMFRVPSHVGIGPDGEDPSS